MNNDTEYYGKEPQLISLEELKEWIHYEDDHLLVINKPGRIVCHPSKNGPFSSLVGACREYTQLERLHLVSRLDRETSGLVILAKHRKMARICQMAFEQRQVDKVYHCLMQGTFSEEVLVDQPLARDMESPVFVKQTVRQDRTAQKATTLFKPIKTKGDYTLCEVNPITGRKHQIRAHAAWLGHPILGDKIYGPDDTLYLEFIEHGWTERLEKALPLKRQALHASQLHFKTKEYQQIFETTLPDDMKDFFDIW